MDNANYRDKSPNRTTTYETLKAVVILLTTNDRDEFNAAYSVATHDDAGNSCWHYMTHDTQYAYRTRCKEKAK